MKFRIYNNKHPSVVRSLNDLIFLLTKLRDEKTLQKAKNDILPLCMMRFGVNHAITKKLPRCPIHEQRCYIS